MCVYIYVEMVLDTKLYIERKLGFENNILRIFLNLNERKIVHEKKTSLKKHKKFIFNIMLVIFYILSLHKKNTFF